MKSSVSQVVKSHTIATDYFVKMIRNNWEIFILWKDLPAYRRADQRKYPSLPAVPALFIQRFHCVAFQNGLLVHLPITLPIFFRI